MLCDWTLTQLQQPLDGLECRGDANISGVSTDSRSLKSGDLFIALSGPNFDGNRFVAQAKAAGAVAAVVSELQPVELPQLLVADTRIALGKLARLHRQAFEGPLVAITGSSGKTSVKEMLARVFEQRGPVLATRGNLNNDIGAPLTLLSLQSEHQYAVVELGASAGGEIAYTTALAQPDVAVLNNAGGAHLEGFGSLQGVVEAKGEIFDGLQDDGVAVVNLDDPNAGYWLDRLEGRKLRTFSLSSPMADLFASHLETADDGCCRFVLNSHDGQVQVALQVMGRHMVANALAAAAAANAVGFELEQIRCGLEAYRGVAGRLAPQPGVGGSRIIDDSYNANPDSVKAAIRVLASLTRQTLVGAGQYGRAGSGRGRAARRVGALCCRALS